MSQCHHRSESNVATYKVKVILIFSLLFIDTKRILISDSEGSGSGGKKAMSHR